MIQVAISRLRQHLPDFLSQVANGEDVQITRFGRIVARIVPFEDQRARARARLAELRRKARVDDVETPVQVPWEALDASA